MLDLSFLTEEEYGKLMKVLQRDAELKKKDSDRIRRLQGSLKDEKKKKFVTGEWFHEVKAQRFQEELEGSELLRASIKKKKNNLDAEESNEHTQESLEGRDASFPSEATTFPSPKSEEERPCEALLDSPDGHQAKPKPRLRLSALPSTTEKRSSLGDTSPADSGVGISPFLVTRGDPPAYEKGHVPDTGGTMISSPAIEDQAIWPPEEVNTFSKIPVKRKSSKGAFGPSVDLVDGAENAEFGLAKRGSLLKTATFSSLGGENGRSVKQGPNYTISSISNKDEEMGLDREHFKNLKNFWEKGGESLLANDLCEPLPEKASVTEINGRPSRLNRSLSVQSQNSDDKLSSHVHSRIRVSCRKPAVLSSSEDEPSYTAHPRKGSGSGIPRSTYGRSKGPASRNSLSDGNGKHSPVEEERKAQRFTRRSKLPVRVPSVKIETPPVEWTGILFEPETPSDEFVMAEESKHKRDSLAGRVQILIQSVPSEDFDKAGSAKEGSLSLGSQEDNLEANEMPPKEKSHHSAEGLSQNGAPSKAGNAKETPEMDSSVPSAYSKPQMLSHQYLEPERAKDLSKSSPLLLSEPGFNIVWYDLQTESDTASEISFQFNRHKKSPSVGSHSSDMASVSSLHKIDYCLYNGTIHHNQAGRKTPPSGEVHIWVKDTKDLPQLRPSGVDSFVKCYVLPDTSKKSYQKTRIVKRDSNPVFNHTIVYDGFHTEDLKDACVELTVWDHEKLTNHFLGGIRLGLGTVAYSYSDFTLPSCLQGSSYGIAVDWMDSTQEEVAFWQEMMSMANEWIEGSLPLRSLAGRRKLK
ncbi:hypothetical protein JD844_004324 [Phrynosoma platyrhinos]|uniref:Synaptotagmin-like protein 2 n=1 Tax=Phrynosoma platyrhinos TaxID=52577 RepID=A0ABQ7TM97_PHRPL|nr:hypothetical protein JD844_004324 [Phrynosoma platyrhinos]